ncbi:gastrin/cholecystokinin type B receptor [Gracilinanus agilis]|uniref:gastrin/cholecystokinin type B receptor n=1 Tax=Gracilinanus agilis TaxID=191870 RepID=UPI001CFC4ED8|nr:gastrin/cholecystokinin type B receptor [Gracilinanus agilis]
MELLGQNRSSLELASQCSPGPLAPNSSANGSANSSCESPRGGSGASRTPRELELAVRVTLYAIIFLLSVGGNVLIITVLGLSRRLRTVTNAFLLSLAVSDLLLAVACMPFTLLPNLMGTFIFGTVVCKAVAYLMGVSVSVSTLSLVAIALERYSAICRPLQARVWQTRSHAARVIVATWLLSGLLMLPYPVYSVVRPVSPRALQCTHSWPSVRARQAWSVLLLLFLFFVPGIVMAVAYGLISRELYLGIRFESQSQSHGHGQQGHNGDHKHSGLPGGPSPALSNGPRAQASAGQEGDGCYVNLLSEQSGMELSALTPTTSRKETRGPGPSVSSRPAQAQAQLQAKKRVVRMLLVIVGLFFLCWLPLYSANTWRAFDMEGAHRALSGAPISFIHLLSYASACVNPLVYCFMHRRFRQACMATCARCRPHPPRARVTRAGPRLVDDHELDHPTTSLSRLSYTTVSTLGPG